MNVNHTLKIHEGGSHTQFGQLFRVNKTRMEN